MQKRIESRLKSLYEEHKRLTDPQRAWVKEYGAPSGRQQIEKCEILIKELEGLLAEEQSSASDVNGKGEQFDERFACPFCGSFAVETTHNHQHDCADCGESWVESF